MKSLTLLYVGNKLQKHGFNPTSVDTLGKRFESFSDVIKVSDMRNKVLRMLDMWRAVIVNRKKVDYVIIDTYGSSAFHFAWTTGRLCALLKIKYIPILRGGELPERVKKNKYFASNFARKAFCIVALSDFLGNVFRKLSPNNVRMIPNFIDVSNYPFNNISDLDNKISILWVRSFHKTYRPQMAVEVVKNLKSNGYNVSLTMVGPNKDGSMDECKKLADDYNLEENILFTGRLHKPEWIKLASKHNIFLNTTSADNTPVSVMEAMALGLPVVTTKVGGIPFLFEDGVEGIMVENADASSLTNAILSLKNNPYRTKSISLAARKKAESWDWDVVKAKWLNLLNPDNAC